MSPRRALFLCDGGPSVGGGHVMRSLTLAGALAERGWRSTFAADGFVGGLLDTFDGLGCDRITVADQRPAALADVGAAGGFDAVIFDHFLADARHQRPARTTDARVVVIDDLADRPHDCDLLVDCNLQRRAEDYATLAPGAELLIGPIHAPVRAAFAAARSTRRPVNHGRALVALGLTDVGGVTGPVVEGLRRLRPEIAVDVVVGRAAPSRAELEHRAADDPAIVLHDAVDAAGMAALMAAAALSVGAGGTSTWERATLGLAGVTLVLADNQAPGAEALRKAGCTVVVDARRADWPTRLEAALDEMDASTLSAMSQRLAALCDGLGAQRTAARIDARVQSGGRQ